QVHAPPVVRHAGPVQLRQQLVEVEHAGAERVVRARLVLVKRAVRVDQVDVRYLALELVEQFHRAAGQGLLGADLVGGDGGAHVGVAGVVEDAEVRVAAAADGIDDLHDLRRLVEGEARLELPADVHGVIGGDLAAPVPDGDDAVHALPRVGAGLLEEV